MASESGWWPWFTNLFVYSSPTVPRTYPVRRNTISRVPSDRFPQPESPYSAPAPPPVFQSRRKEINFYHKEEPYYEFTNFSPHTVVYEGKSYPTSEHLFQAFKFLKHQPQIAERIRSCGNEPRKAFDIAHKYQRYVRDDWRQVNVDKMRTVLRLKFTQHQTLKDLLLGTKDAHLIEDSPIDYFWGIGADRSGQNQLGKLLEELRGELRKDANPPHQTFKREPQRRSSWPSPLPTNFRTAGPSTSRADSKVFKASALKDDLGSNTCEFCHQRPKNPPYAFCGKVCSQAYETAEKYASLCENCHARPKYGRHPYCGRTCAAAARTQAARTQSQQG